MAPTARNPRPWAPGDAADVTSLRATLELSGEPVCAAFDRHGQRNDEPDRRSLTQVAARDASVLLGAGTVYESPVAPARWRLALHVHPTHRRRGIGSALLDALAAAAALRDDRALQVGLSAAATASQDFFVNRGFRDLMCTRLGRLDPTRLPDSTWLRISKSERWAQRRAL